PGLRDEEFVQLRCEGLGCEWGVQHADGDGGGDGRGAVGERGDDGDGGGGHGGRGDGVHGGGVGCGWGYGDVHAGGAGCGRVHDRRVDGGGDAQWVAGLRGAGELQRDGGGFRRDAELVAGADGERDGRGAGDHECDDGDGGGGDGCERRRGDVRADGSGCGSVHDRREHGCGDVQCEPGLRDEEFVQLRCEGLGCEWGVQHADGDGGGDGRGAVGERGDDGDGGGGHGGRGDGVHGGGVGCGWGYGDVLAGGAGCGRVHDRRVDGGGDAQWVA